MHGSPQPIVCPVAFGRPGVEALAIWLDYYTASGSSLAVAPVTTTPERVAPLATKLSAGFGDLVSPSILPDCVKAHPQHLAGWVKVAAHMQVDGPVLAMDCDAVPLRPLEILAAELYRGAVRCAMAPDPDERTYDWWPEVGKEMNSGVLWVDDPGLAMDYLCLWDHLAGKGPAGTLAQIPWADEVVMTAVWRAAGAYPCRLNRRWNYSHWKRRDAPADVGVMHYHGNGKVILKTEHELLLARMADEVAT